MANSAFTHNPSITVPSSTVNNRVVTWDGTTGKIFDDGTTVTINAGVVAGVTSLLLANSSNAYGITLNTGATGANYTITMPTAAPAAGKVLKTTSGSTTQLEWGDAGGGTDASVRAYNSSAISVGHADWQTLTFNSERFDTGGTDNNGDDLHNTSSDTGRLTCRTAGKYIIIGNARFETNSTGQRMLRIAYNGSTEIGIWKTDAGASEVTAIVSTIYELAVGDYVVLQAYQNSSSTINIEVSANSSPEFMMAKVVG